MKTDKQILDQARARRAIIRRVGRKGDGTSSTIPCPCCEHGSLRFTIFRTGHVSGHCSTEGCVSWDEKPPR